MKPDTDIQYEQISARGFIGITPERQIHVDKQTDAQDQFQSPPSLEGDNKRVYLNSYKREDSIGGVILQDAHSDGVICA